MISLIETRLKELLTNDSIPQKKLFEAAQYTTLAQGKRLRPLLVLTTVESFGGDTNAALTPACALELIHSYSLIHDDLPCMDNDDFRRGQLTLHKKYDEATAVLTGDLLLTYAFEILSTAPLLTPEERLSLISILGKRTGALGMIGGQFLDINAENSTLEDLEQIHRKKTADLLTACLEFGAIIAKKSVLLPQMAQIGEKWGLVFQILDDVLDVTHPEKKHGRKISSDQLQKKSTYASLMGVEKATLLAQKLSGELLNELQQFPFKTTTLVDFAKNSLTYQAGPPPKRSKK